MDLTRSLTRESPRDPAAGVLRPFYALWVAWAVVYVSFDVFPQTVEHVESFALKALCLNLPLQLVLMALSVALVSSFGARGVRAGRVCAVLASLLIVGHVLVTAIAGI